MLHYPGHLILGGAVFLIALLIRAYTTNRLVQRKLRLSLLLAAVYLALNAALAWAPISARIRDELASLEHLLLLLAALSILILVSVNPLRADRIPDRFPTIVQDFLLVGLFLAIATFIFPDKLFTTSAVGAVVVGFALQDTLGNAFAGLAIQIEKPFHVGHWVAIGGHEGRVAEITWRATKLRTRTGNFIIVPNNVVSKEAIVNYSEPAAPTMLMVDVGASYFSSPGEVKAGVQEALGNCRRVLATPAPEVLLQDFADSAITYRIRFWVQDYETDDVVPDQVRSAIYYGFRRRGIEIPWPIQIQYERKEESVDPTERARRRADLLAGLDLFAQIPEADLTRLAAAATDHLFGEGERIVREGEPGQSLFAVASGRVAVLTGVGNAEHEVATIDAGSYFGEMSLLTGEPRSATVAARGDCHVVEIEAARFREVAEANPLVLEHVALAAMARRESLASARAVAAARVAAADTTRAFIARMKRFLRLP
jgi:small-conductance mechanosensitive channel/CRP-like cAMP-binding protein